MKFQILNLQKHLSNMKRSGGTMPDKAAGRARAGQGRADTQDCALIMPRSFWPAEATRARVLRHAHAPPFARRTPENNGGKNARSKLSGGLVGLLLINLSSLFRAPGPENHDIPPHVWYFLDIIFYQNCSENEINLTISRSR